MANPLFTAFDNLLSLDLIINKQIDVNFNTKTKQYRMLFDETKSAFTYIFFCYVHLLQNK